MEQNKRIEINLQPLSDKVKQCWKTRILEEEWTESYLTPLTKINLKMDKRLKTSDLT